MKMVGRSGEVFVAGEETTYQMMMTQSGILTLTLKQKMKEQRYLRVTVAKKKLKYPQTPPMKL